jgi:hypothetical protein
VGILLILNLPIAYFFLKRSSAPQYVFYISIFISIIALFLRLYFVKVNLKLSVIDFFKVVIVPIVFITSIAFIMLYLVNKNSLFTVTWEQLIFKSVFIFILTLVSIVLIGMNKDEKIFIKNFIQNKFIKN